MSSSLKWPRSRSAWPTIKYNDQLYENASDALQSSNYPELALAIKIVQHALLNLYQTKVDTRLSFPEAAYARIAANVVRVFDPCALKKNADGRTAFDLMNNAISVLSDETSSPAKKIGAECLSAFLADWETNKTALLKARKVAEKVLTSAQGDRQL